MFLIYKKKKCVFQRAMYVMSEMLLWKLKCIINHVTVASSECNYLLSIAELN